VIGLTGVFRGRLYEIVDAARILGRMRNIQSISHRNLACTHHAVMRMTANHAIPARYGSAEIASTQWF
jgi:hypothetical protein